jgi:hypothetical protein
MLMIAKQRVATEIRVGIGEHKDENIQRIVLWFLRPYKWFCHLYCHLLDTSSPELLSLFIDFDL